MLARKPTAEKTAETFEMVMEVLRERGLPTVGAVVYDVSAKNFKHNASCEPRKIQSVSVYDGCFQFHYKDGSFWDHEWGDGVFPTPEHAKEYLKRAN